MERVGVRVHLGSLGMAPVGPVDNLPLGPIYGFDTISSEFWQEILQKMWQTENQGGQIHGDESKQPTRLLALLQTELDQFHSAVLKCLKQTTSLYQKWCQQEQKEKQSEE